MVDISNFSKVKENEGFIKEDISEMFKNARKDIRKRFE